MIFLATTPFEPDTLYPQWAPNFQMLVFLRSSSVLNRKNVLLHLDPPTQDDVQFDAR